VIAAVFCVLLAAVDPAVERDVVVRTREGVVLRADVWRPSGSGPFPVLVYRTPYDKRKAPEDYTTVRRAVARGYAVVVQDVRGRYASDGDFDPYRHEGLDGYDTIEWAAAQPWSNGRVGTFGLSYPGAVQWLAAVEAPPHLLAMVPAMTFSRPDNFFNSGGVFDLSWISWIWKDIAPDARRRLRLPGPRTDEEAEKAWPSVRDGLRWRLPLSDLREFRDIAPYYFVWMSKPPGDPYWSFADLRGRYGRVGAAVLNFSGWNDDAYGSEGAITNFTGLLAARRGDDDPRTQLVLGPWVHGSAIVNDPSRQVRSGDRVFGAGGGLDYDELVLRFLDFHVRGVANGVDREPRVRAYVMGEDVWRESGVWPLPGTRPLTLYLDPVAREGSRLVGEPPAKPSSISFVSDPASPVVDVFTDSPGGHDYRALAQLPDVAVFETPPFAEDQRVVGMIRASVEISTDAPDVDLWVRLFDVAEDGTSWNLMSPGLDVQRASYRDGGPERKLLTPGTRYTLRFETLTTGNLFRKGHRLRAVICGSFFPGFSRNLQTGEPEATSSAMRKATITVQGGPSSRLVLPLVP
jgi:putative CocE/NonD family hydrolase